MHKVWFGMVLVAAACGSGGNGHDPAAPAAGSSSGGTRSRPIGTTQNDAGAGTDTAGTLGNGGAGANNAGGATEGGDPGEVFQMAGAPAMAAPGVCDPTMKLGANQAEDVGVPSATLLSMTADELSVAFTTGSADTLALYVADRVSTKAAFVSVAVTIPDGYEAKSGVSLSGDGTLLVLVSSPDHAGFGQLSRAKRGDAFGADVDVTAFAKINSLKPMSGASVGWPVLSNDGQDLYFLSYFGRGLVNQSVLGKDGRFSFGTEIDEFTLGGDQGAYKLISGISSDERAIFFVDQATNHAGALFRSRAGAPFYDPLDLGARMGVVPNADCSRVYSSVSTGVVVQTTK